MFRGVAIAQPKALEKKESVKQQKKEGICRQYLATSHKM